MPITHQRASQLIQAELDGSLSPRDRAALEEHLEGCAQCRAERARMARLDSALDASLRGRWGYPNASQAELSRVIAKVEAGAKPGFWLRRTGFGWLGSAGQYAAIALAVAVVALMLGSLSGRGGFLSAPESETPTGEVSETATGEPSITPTAATEDITETQTLAPTSTETASETSTPSATPDTPTATETPPPTLTPTVAEATATLTPSDAPATEQPSDTPTPGPTGQPQAEGVVVGCAQTEIHGQASMPAPFVRVTVTLASNLFNQLAAADAPVGADLRFSATLTYSAQPAGTRLIVAFGEWDGSQFLRPATLNGYDCSG